MDCSKNVIRDIQKICKLIKGRSLEVIPALDYKFDCVLIDGDHNYYAVYSELSLLKDKIAEGGIVFIHDVASCYCAFDDLYYDINSVPFEFRNRKGKIYPGTKDAPRNRKYKKQGILNAVLDFLRINKGFIPGYFTWRDKGILALEKHSERNIGRPKEVNLILIQIILKILIKLLKEAKILD